MEPDELTLSDVHVGRNVVISHRTSEAKNYQVAVTRFLYKCMDEADEKPEGSTDTVLTDRDGDLVLVRQPAIRQSWDVITIEHTMETKLTDVGLQVWPGCLLLCDFILDNKSLFDGCHALELGGGVGLASITMATIAKTVICTDIGTDVLQACAANAERNKAMYKYNTASEVQNEDQNVIRVKELDWTKEITQGGGLFEWSGDDLSQLQNIDIILAADVIYDNDQTDAFFLKIYTLMCIRPCTLYVALERRLNFTLADLEVSCPAYEYYEACVSELCRRRSGVTFSACQVSTHFKQYFQYDRNKYLELWKIEAVRENTAVK